MTRHLPGLLALLALLALAACPDPTDDDDDDTADDDDAADTVEIPDECSATFESEAFTVRREQLSSLDAPSWVDYAPADSAIVWTSEASTGHCAFLWHGGQLRAATVLSEPPSLFFGAYGWLIPYEGTFLDFAVSQPDELRDWVLEAGSDRATLFPVESSYSALDQLRLPIHEAFHVDIQIDAWFGSSETWMSWSSPLLADDLATRLCYEGGSAELAALVAGLDGDCPAAASYLELRDARRVSQAESGVTVTIPDGGSRSCTEAERIWESFEGLADWASLGMLDRAGLVEPSELSSYLLAVAERPYYRPALAKMIWMDRAGSDVEGLVESMVEEDSLERSIDWYFAQEVAAHCD